MANPVPLPPPGFDDLTVDEQISYVQSLLNRIAAGTGTMPVPDWHLDVVRDRLDDLHADPDAGDSWEAARSRLRDSLDNPR
jgi:putative addiction module component (TIGR02574 family)